MSFFSKILDKLGIGNHNAGDAAAQTGSTTQPAPVAPAATTSGAASSLKATPAAGSAASADGSAPPIAIVDVEAQLEQRAATNSQKLNWRTSIVDLLKLLDIDSSLEARKALAAELHCPPELMNDSAKMNIWLHKMVLAKIAVNGGKVPQSLLD